MKKYILGFLAFVGLNLAGLFSLGMIVGFVMALGGERNADALEQSAWFNTLVLVIWPIISFFAFKFSIQRIVLKTKDEALSDIAKSLIQSLRDLYVTRDLTDEEKAIVERYQNPGKLKVF